jgi:hypothetical protein
MEREIENGDIGLIMRAICQHKVFLYENEDGDE